MKLQNATVRPNARSVPSAGMRGGLGRTLLTAFLVLSIVPLSLISFIAATQARQNLERELGDKLATIAILTESQFQNWVVGQQQILNTLSESLALSSQSPEPDSLAAGTSSSTTFNSSSADPQLADFALAPTLSAAHVFRSLAGLRADNPAYIALLLMDQQGHVVAAYPPTLENRTFPDLWQHQPVLLEVESQLIQDLSAMSEQPASSALMLSQPVAQTDLGLVALLDPRLFAQMIGTSLWPSQNTAIYLVPSSGQALKLSATDADIDPTDRSDSSMQTAGRLGEEADAALSEQSSAGNYVNHNNEKVIAAYRWLPQLNAALLVEQGRDSALAASDDLAVFLIGVALAMVLLTAIIAAAVTRRITLPIVQLTATAVQIAAGDLDQRVPATRRDEIGILARAFNVMTTKLRLLYEDLEQKVRERTQQLESANAEIRYLAMQLAISAEVGRVVTSILDQDLLPSKVVELVHDCFQAYFVAIYLTDESGYWAVLREATGGLGAQLKAEDHRVNAEQDHLVSRAIKSLEPQMCAGPPLGRCTDCQRFPDTRAELAVPLKVGRRIIGVLDVHSTREDAFGGNEVMVLETLSGQVAVAIENARVYDIERQAAEQLRELEELRRHFLGNMSRELRMPLNNIIGFSRLMIKGIDGPITDLQCEDLNAIHDSGQQLLVLINDILDIAHIEAGELELSIQPVDLGELAHSVIPSVNALLQGKPIEFHCQIQPDLPPVLADPHRLRQVLFKLLSNAAKFTQEGEIRLRLWRDMDQILVSVIDTGIGIPDKDREKVFQMFQQLSQPVESYSRGPGLGLTFSKEIVEMHGGRIWLESKEGKGTAFTITLPIAETENDLCHKHAPNGNA
jgi:signal transduction histidine kinase